MKPLYRTLRQASVLAFALLTAATLAAEGPPAFRIYTEKPGVYRVDHAMLAAAGLGETEVPSAGLAIENLGQPMPIWIDDGGDGVFSTGDRLEFVAEHLAGDPAYFHEHTRFNVYRLRLDGEAGARMSGRRAAVADAEAPPQGLRRALHLERDELFVRLSGHEIERSGNSELWYWAKLTHIDRQPFSVDLDFSDLDATAGTVSLRAQFRGLSLPRRRDLGLPDHVVELSLDGEPIGEATWGGRDLHEVELEIDAERFAGGRQRLEMRVPKRRPEGSKHRLVDALVLNWIELSFASSGLLDAGMRRFEPVAPAAGSVFELTRPEGGGAATVIFTSNGQRIEPEVSPGPSGQRLRFESAGGETWYFAADSRTLLPPVHVELDRPSDLTRTDRRADYLMIVHRRLRQAVEPLADFHRRRGLEVLMVDVQDVYDEFNHGVLHPRAVRDFIDHAYHRWRQPAPRFVLLVGDASWDSKHDAVDDANYANWTQQQLFQGDRFVARDTPVVPDTVNRRNLIPTWNYHSGHGHSASDNYFVSVAGDDFLPDLAIGRLPVTEPAEVRAIVDKTISYATDPPVGTWRRDILWITNDQASFQRRSDRLAAPLEARGYGSLKVYPEAAERSNELHQAALQQAFDRGTSLVHFYGHGGRHIWRTGPPDFKKNHDLFTLEHIDQLQPNNRLPLVLSMTCFSAPFDHPNADSIGEKFLRVADRGAIAVLAASWRNSPSPRFSQALLDELLVPGTPIGSAIVRAKAKTRNRTLVETYNLLGDPAVSLPVPTLRIDITTLGSRPAAEVSATLEAPGFSGQAIVEWLDDRGRVLGTETLEVAVPSFEASFAGDGEPVSVRIYAWDERAGVDGIGALSFSADADADPVAGRR